MEPAKILVVDDEESIRFTFASFLRSTGAEVTTVAEYDEALACIKQQPFDLLFADILLENRTGIELLREMRQSGVTTPLVLITGVPELDTAVEALRLGAFDYIAKPVTRDALLRVMQQALALRRSEIERESYRGHLETLLNNVHDGIVTVDHQLRLRTRNRVAERLCPLAYQAAAGAAEPGAPCHDGCLLLLREALAMDKTVEQKHFQCRHQSGERLLSLRAAPLVRCDGLREGAMLTIREERAAPTLDAGLRSPPRQQYARLFGKNPRMQEIFSLVEVLSDVDSTVLITGESGTGKELVVEALHRIGSREGKPLVKVNCVALSEHLLESELFGHVKGSFTGAIADKVGRFQKAHGGTIFLDEIGDIPPALQVRLLRVLQEKEFERVGDATPIKVDVRILAATNQDLLQKVRQGRFREDLYYRLKVVNIDLPPLRKRKEDIPQLMEHFRQRFNQQHNRTVGGFVEEVLLAFLRYDWPGNVRELEHAVEHALVLCKGKEITVECLPEELRPATTGSRQIRRQEVDQVEALRCALEKAGGNKAKAARLLGVSRQTLYRKLAEHGFEVDEVPDEVAVQ